MKHPDFAKRFNEAVADAYVERRIANDSQLTLGKSIGVSGVTIWSYRKGEKLPRMNTALRIASVLGVTVEWLLTGQGAKKSGAFASNDSSTGLRLADDGDISASSITTLARVPVLTFIQAGDFREVVDNYQSNQADEWLETDVPVKQRTFALIVEGDSMEPEFAPGMRVVVEPDMDPENGDYVIAGNGEQATLKKLVRDGDDWYLKPLNPRYPIKPLGSGRIIGVVRAAYKKYR